MSQMRPFKAMLYHFLHNVPISQQDSQDGYEDVHIDLPDEDGTQLLQAKNECTSIYEPICVRKFIVHCVLSYLICWFIVLAQAQSFVVSYSGKSPFTYLKTNNG